MSSAPNHQGLLARALTRLGRGIAHPLGRRYAGDRRGNVLIIFGLSALPLKIGRAHV